MMKKLIACLIFFASLASASAFASNEWFMVHTPIANFTQEDMAMFNHSVARALATGRNVHWSNSKTGAQGSVKPLQNFQGNGPGCRELVIYNEAKGLQNQSQFQFCKVNGQWQAVN